MSKPNYNLAFTLAELLIALAILGVIATFTIPKILDSGSNSQFNAIAKEGASIVSQAMLHIKKDGALSASTSSASITPYVNYVRRQTIGTVDRQQGATTWDCSAADKYCLVLHNGGVLYFDHDYAFDNTFNTNGIPFWIDPDGISQPTTNGPGKAVMFVLYYNGRITTYGTLYPNTAVTGTYPFNPSPSSDPPWFSWSN